MPCKYCDKTKVPCPFLHPLKYQRYIFDITYEELRKDFENSIDVSALERAEYESDIMLELAQYKGPHRYHNVPKKSGSDYSKTGNRYFITLTSHPDQLDPNDYYKAIVKILKQKAFKTTYGYGCIELTKTGQPHGHIYMECVAFVKLAMLKRQWKHSSIDVKRVKFDNGIKNYINKDIDNEELSEYLKKHDCKRVYELQESITDEKKSAPKSEIHHTPRPDDEKRNDVMKKEMTR